MVSFDYVSDLHADFKVKNISNEAKFNKSMELFLVGILPAKSDRSEVLIVSGDISNSNNISKKVLGYLSNEYDKIFIVWGNHDLYLDSKNQRRKYKANSLKRLEELESYISSNLFNVEVLDGNIIEYNGIKYGGTGMWYDFSYGLNILGLEHHEIVSLGNNLSNDFSLINGMDFSDYFISEYTKMKRIAQGCDVIISHIPPNFDLIKDDSYIEDEDKDKGLFNFYCFDGSEIINNLKNKIWIFGHVHGVSSFTDMNNNIFLRNALGYDIEDNLVIKKHSFEVS